jgi:hypothetical protein
MIEEVFGAVFDGKRRARSRRPAAIERAAAMPARRS